jgi:cellulose synthase/poly-beta-1,6-N-acetylglucosamine synthase-like glycosyltransferase
VLFLSLIIQLFYYLYFYRRVAWPVKDKNRKFADHKEPVSIVICARNESDNLINNLPLILQQDYPSYEVVVVNDCSEDDSQDILEKINEKYPHLHITQIKKDEKFIHGKKLALTIGIKAAKNEWLLLTDADCTPTSNQWLSNMQRNFTDNTAIVLGYGGYKTEKGFLNRFIRFDTFFIAMQYLSFAMAKLPYMGVGRNLAYRKSLFLKNKGFASHAHIISGDDDLFINEVANSKNTTVELSREAFTVSIPKKTFRSWTFQKKRHFLAGYKYKFSHKFLLGSELFTRLVFLASIIILLCRPGTWEIGLFAFLFRLIVQQVIFGKAMDHLKEKNLLVFSFIFDIVIPLLNIFLYTVNIFNSKQHKWK